ncbi:MAG: hypothetical protein WC969_05880 [Elusimicrobiota bacterium]|jgi:hypothetical protein
MTRNLFLLLVFAAAPALVRAQGNVKVDAGAVNLSGATGVVGSGVGTVGTGTSLPTGGNIQIHTGPALPSVSGGNPSVRTHPGGANASVSVAQPAASFTAPAAVQQQNTQRSVSPASAQTPSLTPKSVVGDSSALPKGTPGAENAAFLKPEIPGGPGGSGVGGAVQELQKARERERKGAQGQVDGALNTMFDSSKTRAAGRETAAQNAASKNSSAAEVLPDPRIMGPEKALEKVRSLAAGASPADAPRLYEHAVSIAKDMPAARSGATVKKIISDASVRAPKAVPELAGDALRSAAENRRAETERYTKALNGWNGLLSTPQEQYISNLPEFQAAVEAVRAQAEAAKGRKLPTPKVAASIVKGSERPRLLLKVKLDAELASDVPTVPQALALSMALPELRTVAAWELPAAGAELRDSFGLAPRGSPAAFYRAARAEGRSVFASFWLASRRWLSARSLALSERLRLAVLRLLQRFGFVQGTPAPAFDVDVSDAALAPLRAQPARELRDADGSRLQSDGLRLGYRIHPTDQGSLRSK